MPEQSILSGATCSDRMAALRRAASARMITVVAFPKGDRRHTRHRLYHRTSRSHRRWKLDGEDEWLTDRELAVRTTILLALAQNDLTIDDNERSTP